MQYDQYNQKILIIIQTTLVLYIPLVKRYLIADIDE